MRFNDDARTREASRGAVRSGGGDAVKSLVDQGRLQRRKIVAASVTAPDLPTPGHGDAARADGIGRSCSAASFDNGKNTRCGGDRRPAPPWNPRGRDSAIASAGGKGGGKPHMAQAGIPDAGRMASAAATRRR